MRILKLIILAFVAAAILGSCKTRTVIESRVETIEVHDTLMVTDMRVVIDSVRLVDSIIVERDTTGKVVYKEVWRDRWHEAERVTERDTIVKFVEVQAASESKETIKETDVFTKFATFVIGLAFAFVLCIIIKKMF